MVIVSGSRRYVGKGELAELLDVSDTTVDRWIRRGCPVHTKGGRGRAYTFDLGAVFEWRLAHERDLADQARKVVKIDDERARKLAAERELAEIELARVRGELVPVDLVAERVTDEYERIRARLEAVASKVAPRVAATKSRNVCRDIVRAEIRAALEELSDGDSVARDAVGADEGSGRRARGKARRSA